ncbi:hypothetical protein BKA64DRAFT_749088 [Cadophora sp. MPI-SDFR-AT-0126]|nr:hypothetical protein BKA64DRAFT_749088 [Leotiomycetes sp. MPI-SDFR-AT-0126]
MTDNNMDSEDLEKTKEYPLYQISSRPYPLALEPINVDPPSDCDTEMEDERMPEIRSVVLHPNLEEQHSKLKFNKSAEKENEEYKWEFLPGTDLSPACLGEPDPSKFFLCLQLVSMPEIKELCQYGQWQNFDWNDPKSIVNLNMFRGRTRHRTAGRIADPDLPWTQMEKTALKSLIERELKGEKTQTTIDCDVIAAGLMSHFKSIIQPAGVPMAQNSTLAKDGSEKLNPIYATILVKNRVGSIARSAAEVKQQATKYADKKNGEDKKHETIPAVKNESQEKSDSSGVGSTSSDGSAIFVDVPGAFDALGHAQASSTTASINNASTPRTTLKRKRPAKTNPPSALKGVRAADNPKHNLTNLAEVGRPDDSKMRFKLKLVEGGYTKTFRFEGRKHPEWENKEWVDGLNKWRIKLLKRYFTTEDAALNKNKSSPRVRWSYAELEYLRMQIRKRVRSTGTTLSGKDWNKLTEQHNERFLGKTVRVGEKLASGKIAVTEQVIEARSQAAITALFAKYEDLRHIVEDEVKVFGAQVSDDTATSYNSSSDLSTSDVSDDSDGDENGAMDYNWEDISDDEDEGRRPVGQPSGGTFVEASS